MKNDLDYGNFTIEYRKGKNDSLFFLKKKILTIDEALKESNKLKDLGYYDVLIKRKEK